MTAENMIQRNVQKTRYIYNNEFGMFRIMECYFNEGKLVRNEFINTSAPSHFNRLYYMLIHKLKDNQN